VGGLATADSVIGGAFLHPIGAKAKHAKAKTRLTDFKFLKYMGFSFSRQIENVDEVVC
jgi:hypothetical protein